MIIVPSNVSSSQYGFAEIDDFRLSPQATHLSFDVDCNNERIFIHEYGNPIDGVYYNSKLHIYDIAQKTLTEVPNYPPSWLTENTQRASWPVDLRCDPKDPNEFFIVNADSVLAQLFYNPANNTVSVNSSLAYAPGVLFYGTNAQTIDFTKTGVGPQTSWNEDLFFSTVVSASTSRVYGYDITNDATLILRASANAAGEYQNSWWASIEVKPAESGSAAGKLYSITGWDQKLHIYNLPVSIGVAIDPPTSLMGFGNGGAYWQRISISPDGEKVVLCSNVWSRAYFYDTDILETLPTGDNASSAYTGGITSFAGVRDVRFTPDGKAVALLVHDTNDTKSGYLVVAKPSLTQTAISTPNETKLAPHTFQRIDFPRKSSTQARGAQTIRYSRDGKYAVCDYYPDPTGPRIKVFEIGEMREYVDPFIDETTLLLKADSQTSVIDISPRNNPITGNWVNYNNAKFVGTDAFGVNFWSTDYYGTSPDSDAWDFGTGDFTVEGWFNIASGYIWQVKTWVSTYGGGSVGWELQHRSYAWVWGHGDTQVISRSYNTVGTWVHVAVCRADGFIRMFFDGVQQGAAVADSTDLTYNRPLYLGNLSAENTSQPVYGQMVDLRITKAARYTSNFDPPTSLT